MTVSDRPGAPPRPEPPRGDRSGPVDMTVAICTYNRSALLRDTLEAMTRLEVPEGRSWELLVVNNACTDETDAVIAEFEGRLPIRGLHEGRPGKSYAANTAVEEARGTYILWTDDDVLIAPDWLRAYWQAFEAHPSASIFGGPIAAHFQGSPPGWVHTMLGIEGRIWAAVDPGPDVIPLTEGLIPLGANMALRRDVHLRCPFDVRIGPRPKGEIRGEETKVIHTLMSEGELGLWIPDARVEHVVPPERQSLAYFRSFFFGLGQTSEILHEGRPGEILGRPRWVWRQAVSSELAYRWWRLLGREERWIPKLMDAAWAWGFLRGGGA